MAIESTLNHPKHTLRTDVRTVRIQIPVGNGLE
jgi:hypothetical protein